MNIQMMQTDQMTTLDVASQDQNLQIAELSLEPPISAIPMSTEVIIKRGYSPFINQETGTWFEYNNKYKTFIDTGVIASGGASALFKNRYEFPNIGQKDVIYVAKDENAMYRFDTTQNIYVLIGTDYHEVESIQCKLKET